MNKGPAALLLLVTAACTQGETRETPAPSPAAIVRACSGNTV